MLWSPSHEEATTLRADFDDLVATVARAGARKVYVTHGQSAAFAASPAVFLPSGTYAVSDTVEDVYEPFLLQEGFLHRTPRGRVATRRAFEYFKVPPPPTAQPNLF